MNYIKSRVYALSKLCINALSSKIEEPRKTINDIKFVIEITDEIVSNLREYPTEKNREDKTKIEIKFKPNDYCYPIFLIGTKYKAFSSPICIDHIRITETQVFYISKRNEEFNERDCFDTKENAQNECNKRNDTAD